jgi:LmbE family N-acetylglucosaminyl deacetylase
VTSVVARSTRSFVDSGMAGDTASDTLVGAPFEAVVAAVHEVIVRARPDVVVSLDPSGGDGHRDHARIAQAAIEAFRRWGGHASLYSWCIPRSLLQRWLDRLAEARPDSGHLELALDQTELGRPDDEITTVIDVCAHLPLRRRAMQVHASQQSPVADMPDDLVEAFLGFDRLVRVEPPWQGGPIESALFVPASSSSSSSERS